MHDAAEPAARISRRATLAGVLLLGSLTACSPADPPGRNRLDLEPYLRHNLVVLSFDALRADELSIYGGQAVPTPAFAALAAEAITADDLLAAAPVTPTAFAAMWSGEWPQRVFRGWRFRPRTTLAEVFLSAGYRTALFANNVQLVPVRGFGRGFEHVDVDDGASGDDPRVRDAATLARSLDWITTRARDETPFLAWVHLLAPHAPYRFRDELAAHYPPSPGGRYATSSGHVFTPETAAERAWIRALYRGEVQLADRYLGRFLEGLRATDLLARTTLVVTADHGEEMGEHGAFQHGETVHRQALHVPLLLRLADGAGAGTRSPLPWSQVDLLPTLAALHGLRAPAVDGIDWLAGGPTELRRLALAFTGQDRFGATASNAQYDLLVHCRGGVATGSLFDRHRDPHQQHDLAVDHPATYLRGAEALWHELGGSPCTVLRAAANGTPVDREPSLQPATAAETAGLTASQVARLRSLGYLAGSSPRADQPALRSTTDAAPTATQATAPTVGVIVDVTSDPEPVPLCEPGNLGATTVRWRGAPGEVRLEVGPTGKLFALGGPSGEATTGPWVGPATEFVLRDALTGALLARRTVGTEACRR